MLFLRAFAAPADAAAAVGALEGIPQVAHVMRQSTADGREEMITADLETAGVDRALELLLEVGLDPDLITVERAITIGPVERHRGRWLHHGSQPVVWAEVVEGARDNAELPARYLLYMFVAGVLAAFAVLLQNTTLIVGAMAVSPDLLPVTAACVGIVGRRPRLFGRAIGALALGLTVSTVTAWALTWILDRTGYLAAKLPTVSELIVIPSTELLLPIVLVAFVAGIAGMIAVETRASAAVGVAISVTTIPAAAYTGVALAIGTSSDWLAGIGVLTLNVLCLLVGGSLTLAVQRLLRKRGGPSAQL